MALFGITPPKPQHAEYNSDTAEGGNKTVQTEHAMDPGGVAVQSTKWLPQKPALTTIQLSTGGCFPSRPRRPFCIDTGGFPYSRLQILSTWAAPRPHSLAVEVSSPDSPAVEVSTPRPSNFTARRTSPRSTWTLPQTIFSLLIWTSKISQFTFPLSSRRISNVPI